MIIFSKMSPQNDPLDPPVNAVKIWKLLKSVKMMSFECIMVKFDGFYSLELTYLANNAKIYFRLAGVMKVLDRP